MEIDCANPTNLPVRISVAKGETFDLTFSGKCDFQRWLTIQASKDGNPHNWQVALAGTGANGGGVWQGPAMTDSLKMTKSENGVVSFSATLKGQQLWAFTANA